MTTNFASKYINKNVITQNRCTVKKFSLKKIDIFFQNSNILHPLFSIIACFIPYKL